MLKFAFRPCENFRTRLFVLPDNGLVQRDADGAVCSPAVYGYHPFPSSIKGKKDGYMRRGISDVGMNLPFLESEKELILFKREPHPSSLEEG